MGVAALQIGHTGKAEGAALYWQPAPRLYGLNKPAGDERQALTDGQLGQLAAVGHVTPMTTETRKKKWRKILWQKLLNQQAQV